VQEVVLVAELGLWHASLQTVQVVDGSSAMSLNKQLFKMVNP
jgi:hypothetical protein